MRAVLWELDGTLVDSAEYHWRAWAATMREAGVVITRAQFLASFGQRNDTILTAWLGPHAEPARCAQLGEAKEAAYRQLMRQGGLVPLPGAAEWVARLRRAGWQQAIASSAPRANVEAVLDALGWHRGFDAMVAAEDVTAGKPDPQVFLVAAERLGGRPARCVVVEDAGSGIEAAERAGMVSIGVGPGGIRATLAVASLAELPPDAFETLVESRGGPEHRGDGESRRTRPRGR
jgi:beta-phosphoglucomutase